MSTFTYLEIDLAALVKAEVKPLGEGTHVRFAGASIAVRAEPEAVAERLVCLAAAIIPHLDRGGLARLYGASTGLGGQVRAALGVQGLEDVTGYITPELATLPDAAGEVR